MRAGSTAMAWRRQDREQPLNGWRRKPGTRSEPRLRTGSCGKARARTLIVYRSLVSILHMFVRIHLIIGDKLPNRTPQEERELHARMSIDNRNLRIPCARSRQIGGERVGFDDVESR